MRAGSASKSRSLAKRESTSVWAPSRQVRSNTTRCRARFRACRSWSSRSSKQLWSGVKPLTRPPTRAIWGHAPTKALASPRRTDPCSGKKVRSRARDRASSHRAAASASLLGAKVPSSCGAPTRRARSGLAWPRSGSRAASRRGPRRPRRSVTRARVSATKAASRPASGKGSRPVRPSRALASPRPRSWA